MSPEQFADTLPPAVAKTVRKDALELMEEYNVPALPTSMKKRLKALSEQLELSKKQVNDTSADIGRLRKQIVHYRGVRVRLSSAVKHFTSRVSGHIRQSAIKNVGSMAAESLPVVGTVVVVTVTALEVKDACDTLKDMHEMNMAFNPDLDDSEDVDYVCGMYEKLPSRAEVLTAAINSPSTVWANTKILVPTLPEMDSLKVDWVEYVTLIRSGVTWVVESSKAEMSDFFEALGLAWQDLLWELYWGSD